MQRSNMNGHFAYASKFGGASWKMRLSITSRLLDIFDYDLTFCRRGLYILLYLLYRGLLQLGATVIINSRSSERLSRICSDFDYPENLVTVHGSLLPGQASKTVAETLQDRGGTLHHVVAHGAVRYWTKKSTGFDETFYLTDKINFLELSAQDFRTASSHLVALHFSAAHELIPRLLQNQKNVRDDQKPSYTFVTGDGSGHPTSQKTAMGQINAHHVWGLSAALRDQFLNSNNLVCRELRVELQVNRPQHERDKDPRERPLSEDIGDLCAGMVAAASRNGENGRLLHISSQAVLEQLLREYQAHRDPKVGALPSTSEFTESL